MEQRVRTFSNLLLVSLLATAATPLSRHVRVRLVVQRLIQSCPQRTIPVEQISALSSPYRVPVRPSRLQELLEVEVFIPLGNALRARSTRDVDMLLPFPNCVTIGDVRGHSARSAISGHMMLLRKKRRETHTRVGAKATPSP